MGNIERRNFIKSSIILGIGASIQAKAGIFDELSKSDKNNPLNLDPLDAFLKSNPKYASCANKKGEVNEGCCEIVNGDWLCYDKK